MHPLVKRRSHAADRGETTSAENTAGRTGFREPSSFPSVGGNSESISRMRHHAVNGHRHQYEKGDLGSGRGANSNRLRLHRSLDASELYEQDPLLSQYHSIDIGNALPPADPPAATDSVGNRDLHASFLLPPDGHFASVSQGNLLHFGSNPGDSSTVGDLFSNPIFSSGYHGRPVSDGALSTSNLGLSFPIISMGTGPGAVNYYQPHSQLQQQPYPSLFQVPHALSSRDMCSMPIPVLQREYDILRREYENTVEKLNSNMNSIKTFWSPELKKERSMRKEEAAKVALVHEQLRVVSQEAQRQREVIRQLQTELQCHYELSKTIRDTELQSVSKDQYEAVRLERERLHRELTLAKETMRDLGMQIESQRQTLATKDESIKKLLDMLQSKGALPYSAAQDRLELEQCRARQIELENRCRRYEAFLQQKEQDIRSLREECLSASDKLRRVQSQCGEQYPQQPRPGMSPCGANDEAMALRSLVGAKEGRIAQMEQRIAEYEREINHLRELKGFNCSPRERSVEKSVTDREYEDVKVKVDKLELELAQKKTELETNKTKLAAAEEQISEFRKHVELAKNTVAAKEEQIKLLDADVKALQAKLESRNETIEQKTQYLHQAQLERNRQQNEVADLNEQLKTRENSITGLQRKIDNLERMVKERDSQLEIYIRRLEMPQTSAQEKQLQEKMNELCQERDQLVAQVRKQNDLLEKEHVDELEIHRMEVRDLRMAIETLQKDITDRQVLIESQQEKISDLTREVTTLRSECQLHASRQIDGDFYVNEFERLHRELQDSRTEVEKLLKMVSSLEKEKEALNSHIRALEKQIEESQTQYSTTFERKIGPSTASADHSSTKSLLDQLRLRHKEHRVEELEAALKESVNITVEHEEAIAQQKHASQHMEVKMTKYKDQMAELKRHYDELKNKMALVSQDKQDKDALIRSLKLERKRHLEEVLQLKEEALLAAISEKDAQIALLETSQTKNPEEIESLRRHKEKLIKKLKEENARRVKLLTEMKETCTYAAAASTSGIGRQVAVESTVSSAAFPSDTKSSPVDQIVQSIRFVELQKKKLRVFIDQLVACILDIDPELLTGLPRTQQSSGVDMKLLKKMTHEQLLLEMQQRDTDSLQLQRYATQLMQRLAMVQPTLVRRAMKLLDSFNGHPSTSEAFFYVRLSRHYLKTKEQGAKQPTTSTVTSSKQKGHKVTLPTTSAGALAMLR